MGPDEAKRISQLALRVGSRVDEVIKRYIDAGLWRLRKSDSIEVVNCLEGYQRFEKEYPYVKVTRTEHLVWSDTIHVAGTIDLEAIDERTGSGILIDVKCSSYISPRYWLQVGTYNSFLPVPHPTIGILRLHKSLAFCDYKTKDYKPEFRAIFDGLLAAYRYYEVENRRETVELPDDRNPTDNEVREEAELDYAEIPHHRPTWRWQI